MRASVLTVWGLLLATACGQHPDHPGAAPACDPALGECGTGMAPAVGIGVGAGNEAGASSAGPGVAACSGQVLAFLDDSFDDGPLFAASADVSATGESRARVSTTYDGTSFSLEGVLQDRANWFLTVPASGTGTLPTLLPVDTRTPTDALSLGVANTNAVDGIFLASSGTERALERAQIALHLVDSQLRSVPGVTGTLTAEVTAYRAAGSWVGVTTQNVTDSSGMIFFGNVPVGSGLTKATISLTGAVSAKVDVTTAPGAISVLTAVVGP
jgi:hypothetical protein